MFSLKYQSLNNKINLEYCPDPYIRYSGSHNIVRDTPYISGYWYLALIPPLELMPNAATYVQLFNSTSESFTPPSRSIVKEEIIGFSNIKKFLITNQEISNSFGLSFRETHNLHVSNVISEWTACINPFTGHINKTYKGHCIVILAKPTFGQADNMIGGLLTEDHIQEIYFFHGVFPESEPIDKFASDINTNETQVIDLNFNFDGMVMNKAFDVVSFLNDFNIHVGEFSPYSPYLERSIPYSHTY
jgi:hypothetical protein